MDAPSDPPPEYKEQADQVNNQSQDVPAGATNQAILYPAVPQYVNNSQVYYQPQRTNNTESSTNVHRSKWLLTFGIMDIVVGGFLFLCCFEVGYIYPTVATSYFGLVCAIFHVTLGILSIFGGRDTVRYRGCVIASLVMGIVGPCIFVTATVTADIIEWADFRFYAPASIFLPILLLSFVQAAVSIVISSISCCKICSCCGYHNPGDVENRSRGYPPYVTMPEN